MTWGLLRNQVNSVLTAPVGSNRQAIESIDAQPDVSVWHMTVLHSTWPALQNHLCGQACMPRIDSYQSLPVKQPKRGGYCCQGKHHHRNVPRGFRRLRTVQIAASRSVSNTQAVIQSNDGKHAREMCKSKVQQELLGVNRGIFGTKASCISSVPGRTSRTAVFSGITSYLDICCNSGSQI